MELKLGARSKPSSFLMRSPSNSQLPAPKETPALVIY